jgi:hypothetical protein
VRRQKKGDCVAYFRAGQVEQRANSLEIASGFNAKAGAGSRVLDILKGVVEEVDVAFHQRAGDVLPVDASIGVAGNSLVLLGTGHRPPCLSDPHRLAFSGRNGLLESIVESCVSVADAVGVLGLPVWVGIDPEEVKSTDNGTVTCAKLDHRYLVRWNVDTY